MSEEWRTIAEDPRYRVSSLGRVMGPKGRVLKTWALPDGRLTVQLGADKRRYVHQLVAVAFIGDKPEGLHVCHNDGNNTNNVPANLRYGTRSENMMDRVAHGTAPRGRRHWNAKLRECEVREIKRALKSGESQQRLALAFGVSRTLIEGIKLGTRWGWLTA